MSANDCDKQMSAAADLELTSAMQVNIAIQACLPVLNLGLDWYRGWKSIVVYPSEFLVPRSITDDDGVVHEYVEPIAGEAWDGGPLLLSWEDAQQSATGAGAAKMHSKPTASVRKCRRNNGDVLRAGTHASGTIVLISASAEVCRSRYRLCDHIGPRSGATVLIVPSIGSRT